MEHVRLFADISSNNNAPNMQEYANSGHLLIAIKATEGTGYVNPDHRTWSLHAGLHHIGVVHYHFARPDLNSDPVAEAIHFLRAAIPLTGGRDYLCVDLERATPQGWAHDPAWSHRFAEHVAANSRFITWLYASRATLEIPGEFLPGERKPVWDADWSTGPDFAPHGYTVAARQSSDGVFGPEPHGLPGIGRCDVNRMSTLVFERAMRER